MTSLNPIEAMQNYLESFNKLKAEKEKLEAECQTLKDQLEKSNEEIKKHQEHADDVDLRLDFAMNAELRIAATTRFLFDNLKYMKPFHLEKILSRFVSLGFLTVEVIRLIYEYDRPEFMRQIAPYVYEKLIFGDGSKNTIREELTLDEKIKTILKMFEDHPETLHKCDPQWEKAFDLFESHHDCEGAKLLPTSNKQKAFNEISKHIQKIDPDTPFSFEVETLIYTFFVTASKHNFRISDEDLIDNVAYNSPIVYTLSNKYKGVRRFDELSINVSEMVWPKEAFDKLSEPEKVYYIANAYIDCINLNLIENPNLAVIYFSRKLQDGQIRDLSPAEMELLCKHYKYLFRVLNSFEYKDSYDEDFPKLKELIKESGIEMKVKEIVPAGQSIELEHYQNQEQRIKNFIDSKIQNINRQQSSYNASLIRTTSQTGKTTHFMVVETDVNLGFETFYIPVSETVALLKTRLEMQKIKAAINVETKIKLCHNNDMYIVCCYGHSYTPLFVISKKDIDTETLMLWYDLHLRTKMLEKQNNA